MKNSSVQFSAWFHKFLTLGMLWFCALGMITVGCVNISIAVEDHVPPQALIIILQVVLILAGALLIRARFGLASFRKAALPQLLAAFLAAAAVFLFDWRVHEAQGELVENSFLFPLLSACWGIAIFRWYRQFDGILKD